MAVEKDIDNNFSFHGLPGIAIKKSISFKFKTSDGLWLNPPDFLPCIEESTLER